MLMLMAKEGDLEASTGCQISREVVDWSPGLQLFQEGPGSTAGQLQDYEIHEADNESDGMRRRS